MSADGDGERTFMRRWRRNLLVMMMTISFAGGMLFGLLASAVQIPAVWLPVFVLAVSGVFTLLMSRPGR